MSKKEISSDNNFQNNIDIKNNNNSLVNNKTLLLHQDKQNDKNINLYNKFQNLKISDNNLFIYNQLKNKLSTKTNENTKLKEELISLRNKIINLESDKVCQKHNINDLIQTNNDLLSLKNIISEKDQIIQSLKEQIISEHKKFNEEFRYRESKFDYELIQNKVQYESAKYKIENYLKIENYSDALYKQLLEMEEIINNFNKIEELNMNRKKIEYMNKLNKFKKKMLDFLKNEINSKENFREQLKLSNLVNDLHIKELIRDIEDLNNEVYDLLEEKQELKYKIFCLVNDINIYKKVIDTVCLKNNRLQNRLFKKSLSPTLLNYKKFFKDKSNKKKDDATEQNDIVPNPKIKQNNKLMKLSNSLSLLFDKYNINNNNINPSVVLKNKSLHNFYTPSISLNKFNSTTSFNSTKNIKINDNIYNIKNNKDLIDKHIELIHEKEKYKKYYEYYRDKYNIIKEKYNSIFKIYNEALEKIVNEDLKTEIKDKDKDIFININDLINFNYDYDKMNTKEKYFILIKLIKHISPLVCQKEIENNKLYEDIFNVKEKYKLGKNNVNSLSFSTEQNSFDISSKYRKGYKTKRIFTNLNENKSTSSLKIIDKKYKKYKNLLGNKKNKQKIFMEFKNYFNIEPISPLKSIPINHFYNGPFSDI